MRARRTTEILSTSDSKVHPNTNISLSSQSNSLARHTNNMLILYKQIPQIKYESSPTRDLVPILTGTTFPHILPQRIRPITVIYRLEALKSSFESTPHSLKKSRI